MLYDFLASENSKNAAAGLGDHPVGEFAWIENAHVTSEQLAVVWEGCDFLREPGSHAASELPGQVATDQRVVSPSPKRRKEWDHDPALQKIADRLVRELQQQSKRVPSLLDLAAMILKQPDLPAQRKNNTPNTIARRIRATWKRAKG